MKKIAREVDVADRLLKAGPVLLSSGKYEDRQMGYATPFQQSWLPASGQNRASTFRAQDSATGGSTNAKNFSTGLENWRKWNNPGGFRQWLGRAMGNSLGSTFAEFASSAMGGRQGYLGQSQGWKFGTVGRSGQYQPSFGKADDGSMRKFQGNEAGYRRQLSEKQIEQRREAGKASGEARRSKLATSPERNLGYASSSMNRQFRAHKDKEFAGTETVSGRWWSVKPQKPAAMSEDEYAGLARNVGRLTRALRDPAVLQAQNRGYLTGKEDPRQVKMAYTHARNLALHDLGLLSLGRDFKVPEQDLPAMKDMENFVRYARRRMKDELSVAHKGTWKQFKDEFGEPFIDKKTGRPKIHPATGEPRKRFYPHMELVKGLFSNQFKGYVTPSRSHGMLRSAGVGITPLTNGGTLMAPLAPQAQKIGMKMMMPWKRGAIPKSTSIVSAHPSAVDAWQKKQIYGRNAVRTVAHEAGHTADFKASRTRGVKPSSTKRLYAAFGNDQFSFRTASPEKQSRIRNLVDKLPLNGMGLNYRMQPTEMMAEAIRGKRGGKDFALGGQPISTFLPKTARVARELARDVRQKGYYKADDGDLRKASGSGIAGAFSLAARGVGGAAYVTGKGIGMAADALGRATGRYTTPGQRYRSMLRARQPAARAAAAGAFRANLSGGGGAQQSYAVGNAAFKQSLYGQGRTSQRAAMRAKASKLTTGQKLDRALIGGAAAYGAYQAF